MARGGQKQRQNQNSQKIPASPFSCTGGAKSSDNGQGPAPAGHRKRGATSNPFERRRRQKRRRTSQANAAPQPGEGSTSICADRAGPAPAAAPLDAETRRRIADARNAALSRRAARAAEVAAGGAHYPADIFGEEAPWYPPEESEENWRGGAGTASARSARRRNGSDSLGTGNPWCGAESC